MTCFWDGILHALTIDDFQYIGVEKKLNRNELIAFLIKNNEIVENVKWNNNELSLNEKRENFDAVKSYDISKINNGHECSTCDYFLLLIAEIFDVTIHHLYRNTLIQYSNIKTSRKSLYFASNNGHFWKKK